MTEQEREKVLHGLDSCGFMDGIPNICDVTECPYREHLSWCSHELAHDAGLLIHELLNGNADNMISVVRCKDCVYFIPNNDEEGDWSGRCDNTYLPMNGTTVDGWWFCADGERRDDE